MKIFKWRIYSDSRVEKITKLINACTEDRELAIALLLGPQKEENEYPRYQVKIEYSKVSLERKLTYDSHWITVEYTYYHNGSEGRAEAIEELKRKRDRRISEDVSEKEKREFKEYTLNF